MTNCSEKTTMTYQTKIESIFNILFENLKYGFKESLPLPLPKRIRLANPEKQLNMFQESITPIRRSSVNDTFYEYLQETIKDILEGNKKPLNFRGRADTWADLLHDASECDTKPMHIDWIICCHVYFWTCTQLDELQSDNFDEKNFKTNIHLLYSGIITFASMFCLEFQETFWAIARILVDICDPQPSIPETSTAIHLKSHIPVISDIAHVNEFMCYCKNSEPFQSVMSHNWPAFTLWRPDYLKETVGENLVNVMKLGHSDHEVRKILSSINKVINTSRNKNNLIMDEPGLCIRYTKLIENVWGFPLKLYSNTNILDGLSLFVLGAETTSRIHHASQHTFIVQIYGISIIRIYPAMVSQSPTYLPHVDFTSPEFSTRYPNFNGEDVKLAYIEGRQVIYVPKSKLYSISSLTNSCFLRYTMNVQ